MIAEAQHPFEGGRAPPWATAWGDDRIGAFAVLTVGAAGLRVVQRMRWIPPGTFTMGSPDGERWRHRDEGPQHAVTLTRGFWLGDTPVTQALWIAVTGENPSRFRLERPGGLERPVESVSWNDCQVLLDHINTAVPGITARLPTEAEWECACRAGTAGPTWLGDPRLQARAAALEDIAWYRDNSEGTEPVRSKAPNPFGLYDMLGNVWEWCADNADRFGRQYVRPSGSATDPIGTGSGDHRFHRGGAWNSAPTQLRAAYRNADLRNVRRSNLGMRLAATDAPTLRRRP